MKKVMGAFLLVCTSVVLADTEGYVFPNAGRYILPVTLGEALLHPCSRSVPKAITGFWEPSETDIDNLEQHLLIYMNGLDRAQSQRPPAEAYDRQYVGIVVHGAKLIYGNYFPPSFSKYGADQHPIDICDGGPRHWGLIFHPKTKSFTDLSFTLF